jgi:hypothetical protein
VAEGVKTGVFCEVATKGNVENLTTLIFMGGGPTRGATSTLILLCMWLMKGMFYVIVMLVLFMMLLKVTMRERNMV